MENNKCVCDYCKSRHSWNCDDGMAYPRGGCEYFSLDWDALSNEQKKEIKRILSHNDCDRPYEEFDW